MLTITGRAAEPELLERIYVAARNIEGVAGVHRVIADYIAGMTDRYAIAAHEAISA